MSYPTINAHRFLYNLDGTRVGYNTTSSYANGITGYLTQTEMNNLQSQSGAYYNSSNNDIYRCFWFIFPEAREITYLLGRLGYYPSRGYITSIQGSNNTTTGLDGTWSDITPSSTCYLNTGNTTTWWKSPVTLSTTVTNSFKMLRMSIRADGWDLYTSCIYNIHLYGHKTTDTDDIIFLQSDGATKYTVLQDFGDTPEGSVENVDMYIKNTSSTMTANSITVAVGGVNASNITVSLDGTTYSSSVTVSSLAPGATQIIKVRNTVGAKPQALIPRSAYLTATVSTWT